MSVPPLSLLPPDPATDPMPDAVEPEAKAAAAATRLALIARMRAHVGRFPGLRAALRALPPPEHPAG